MDIDDRRTPDRDLGPRIAAGRDNVIYEVGGGAGGGGDGGDRVLRRTPDERSFAAEARLMEHVREAGYPVPQVHRVGPGEMVLDRIVGPTMLDDIGRLPWRLGRHARTLADLHHRLHAIAPPAISDPIGLRPLRPDDDGLPAGPEPSAHADAGSIVHLDLHPGNVILSPDGPVVIDWTNARRGPGPVDVAVTWIILTCMEVDGSAAMRALVTVFRRRLADRFLASAGRDEARRALGAARDHRALDRNLRPSERAAIDRLVAAEGRTGDG